MNPEDQFDFELICEVCGEYESECICDLDWDIDEDRLRGD